MSFLFSVLVNFILILFELLIAFLIFYFVGLFFNFLVVFASANPRISRVFFLVVIVFFLAVVATIEYGILI